MNENLEGQLALSADGGILSNNGTNDDRLLLICPKSSMIMLAITNLQPCSIEFTLKTRAGALLNYINVINSLSTVRTTIESKIKSKLFLTINSLLSSTKYMDCVRLKIQNVKPLILDFQQTTIQIELIVPKSIVIVDFNSFGIFVKPKHVICTTCRVCSTEDPDLRFVSCGHQCMHERCYYLTQPKNCPICNKNIAAIFT
jgi:hypothetical protein